MLLFNQFIKSTDYSINRISIHLMLLFNRLAVILVKMMLYFNTSNVTIQQYSLECCKAESYISIHLMLLFNLLVAISRSVNSHFNTSNVTIQRKLGYTIRRHIWISIHLMLLFNLEENNRKLLRDVFQYI